MKNITFLIWTAVIVFFLVPQNVVAQPEYQLDRIEGYLWDDPNWFLGYRTQYTYDDPGADFTNLVNELYDETGWHVLHQIIRTYNDDNTLNTEIFQDHGIFLSDDLVGNYKTEYEYDSSGNNAKVTRYSANDIGGWTKTGQDILMYENGLNTEIITYVWKGYWKKSKKIEKIYNSENLKIREEKFNWESTGWSITPRHTIDYTYNLDGLLKDETEQQYYAGTLVNKTRTEYLYVNDKLSLETHYKWSTTWYFDYEQQYSYQPNGQLKEIIKTSSSYSPIKTVYVWRTLGINSYELMNGKAYPNPFTSVLHIALKTPLERQGALVIYDINGKEISKTELNKGVKTITVNKPGLANGIYFVKIFSGSFNQTFKVIKR